MKKIRKNLPAFAGIVAVTAACSVQSVFAAAEPTFGEKMAQAGRNTLIGLITVFIILLALSFIISLFKFIAPKKKAAKKDTKTEFVNKTAPKKDSAEDEELAAVIIAAICASEGNEYIPGQYRLKSIKRVRSTRSWNKARRDA